MGHVLVACSADSTHIAYIQEGASLTAERFCREPGCAGAYKVVRKKSGALKISKGVPSKKGVKARYADAPLTRERTGETALKKLKEREAKGEKLTMSERLRLQELEAKAKGLEAARSKMEVEDSDPADTEFVFGSDWNPDWRLTASGAAYAARDQIAISALVDATHQKMTKAHTITNAPQVRLSTDGTMGRSAVDAAKTAGRILKAPTLAKQATGASAPAAEEWCHLVAHRLGGKVEPGNLVAASHACNTYMATIEAVLHGRSDLAVQVTAFCCAADVAEQIKYEVYKSNVLKWTALIDARAAAFSKDDQEAVREAMKKALPV